MKKINRVFVLLLVAAVFSIGGSAQDLLPDEIIAKHLDAIGTKDARAGVKTLFALGTSEFESKIPIVKGGGRALVVSDPDNLFFIISLNSREYPFEKIGYFNGKASLPYIASGSRSLLGLFINEHIKILSDGLFGGTMSLRWALLDPELRKAKSKSAGIKKVDGKKLYAIDYLVANMGSNEFTIRLFFDEKFNHVRSEYRREVIRGQITFGSANQQANAKLALTETFSDFRTVDGITLPYTYRVNFVSNSNSSINENEWGINVEEYRLNQKLAPDFFTFDTK
ncbi:MAG: hypothetical protein ABL952_09330 [Pyrinomonadaceae bacterium]